MSLVLTRSARRATAAPLLTLMLVSLVVLPGLCDGMGSEPADALAEPGAAHHGMHAARDPGADHRAMVATAFAVEHGDGHDSTPLPCTMMGHCVAGLPGIGPPPGVWATAVQEPASDGPAWQIHAAILQHLTPPPRA